MAKPKRSVWEPTKYLTMIGETEYTLTPQPISQVMEFDELLNEVGSMFDALGSSFEVHKGDEHVDTFDTNEEAKDFVEEQKNSDEYEVRQVGVEIREFLSKLSEGPFLILKPLIPDLKVEDVQSAPMPQIEYVIGLLVEINGMKWFEGMVKNFLEPLLPTVIQATAGALRAGLPDSTDKEEK